VEVYGGVLLHTWLDRDLSLAGRAVLRGPSGPRSVLVDFGRPLLRIPNLAIHLQREISTQGLRLDPQAHVVPVLGLEGNPTAARAARAGAARTWYRGACRGRAGLRSIGLRHAARGGRRRAR
jgi:aspartyl aminopeptidase